MPQVVSWLCAYFNAVLPQSGQPRQQVFHPVTLQDIIQPPQQMGRFSLVQRKVVFEKSPYLLLTWFVPKAITTSDGPV
jgi:hypothetical protein